MNEQIDKKEILKRLINELHEGACADEIKEKFKEVLRNATPPEIAQVEEELIEEGMRREEIQKLCDAHLEVFKESLEREKTLAPVGYPVNILMEEHKNLLEFAENLRNIARAIRGAGSLEGASGNRKQLMNVVNHLKDSESHYLREENVLFPYLERHGITQPPAMMWSEHEKIREIKKKLYNVVDAFEKNEFNDFIVNLGEVAQALTEMLSSHFYKENNVLFPTALEVIEEDEWEKIRNQFDEIGYCCFTPEGAVKKAGVMREKSKIEEGMIACETGSLSTEEIEALLDGLPVDITFVGKDDSVRYFNQSPDRIFVRTKAVIGRRVQQCHPAKSIHVVNKILEDFKEGKRNVAEFWITMNERLIYIRYFAIRDKNKNYLGCLEVTQDVTDIGKLEGEKRLLD